MREYELELAKLKVGATDFTNDEDDKIPFRVLSHIAVQWVKIILLAKELGYDPDNPQDVDYLCSVLYAYAEHKLKNN